MVAVWSLLGEIQLAGMEMMFLGKSGKIVSKFFIPRSYVW